MAGSSRRAIVASLAMALPCASACVSGRLFEASRSHEQVSQYEAAWAGDERLLLRYTVELGDRNGSSRGFEVREVSLALDDLRARPEIPVERFPVTPVRIAEAMRDDALSLLVLPPGAAAAPGVPSLRVIGEAGQPLGFEWKGDEAALPARFHSGALYRVHYAWWLYPLLPLAATVDLALLPIELVAAIPLFVVNE